MRSSHGLLIRFIDLGLLLLMAFLAIADLTPTLQVPLPQGGGGASVRSVMRIQFDEHTMVVRREPAGHALCQEVSLQGLAECIQALTPPPTPYLLTPVTTATVQRLVSVMDVCRQERVACALAPLHP